MGDRARHSAVQTAHQQILDVAGAGRRGPAAIYRATDIQEDLKIQRIVGDPNQGLPFLIYIRKGAYIEVKTFPCRTTE